MSPDFVVLCKKTGIAISHVSVKNYNTPTTYNCAPFPNTHTTTTIKRKIYIVRNQNVKAYLDNQKIQISGNFKCVINIFCPFPPDFFYKWSEISFFKAIFDHFKTDS